ncbi:KxYKxGKxW signal peptide domain-containing protein [Nicoliella spurrieriana]|uniref:KxYKxGKxW signal peptide domain-containing protein n=1 Tax=Nicoliella spurrieriana TaxID=2925830 RepID=A0A976RT81_9LACO|nr:KxYKxGKxW signal peptide domain-containing protein [Nicoliella spurrieriana]UQS87383.1 KxYKxGKxW signal peptide domain-containing protein [Nicoliella spurrieriana]
MLYNKFEYSKVNDKKVLRKVKKQWVVMSLSMFTILGGGAAIGQHITTVSANANTSTYTSDSNSDADSASSSTDKASASSSADASANNTTSSQ